MEITIPLTFKITFLRDMGIEGLYHGRAKSKFICVGGFLAIEKSHGTLKKDVAEIARSDDMSQMSDERLSLRLRFKCAIRC